MGEPLQEETSSRLHDFVYRALGHECWEWAYYRSHGLDLGDAHISDRESLALFGYPISEPMMEAYGGQQLLVQYFERARLEIHPNNPQAYRILQGRLGSETHAETDDHRAPAPGPGHDDNDHRTPSPGPGHDDDHRTPSPGPGHDDDNHGGHH
jgi:hypothetical protein